jgi:hypothetical protein
LNTDSIIKPFDDFWVNCIFNTQISVLIFKEPSFKYVAYLNDYYYAIEKSDIGAYDVTGNSKKIIHFLTLNSMQEVTSKYIYKYFSFEPFNYKDEEYGLEKLVEMIKQHKLIAIGVDLFYWISGSYCWNKYHWQHYAMITGFDDEREIFFTLDDNVNGFGHFEIPAERFYQASQSFYRNEALNTDAYIVNVDNDLEQFELTLKEVMFFTEKLKQKLGNIDAMSLLDLNGQAIQITDWFDLFVKYVHQVINRQTANALLFKSLGDLNLIRERSLVSGLIQQANTLKKDWRILEQKIVKFNCLSPDQFNANEFCDRCNRLFHREIVMWNTLLAYEGD